MRLHRHQLEREHVIHDAPFDIDALTMALQGFSQTFDETQNVVCNIEHYIACNETW